MAWKYLKTFFNFSFCLACTSKVTLESTILFTSQCPHMKDGTFPTKIYITKIRMCIFMVLTCTVFLSWLHFVYIWYAKEGRSSNFIEDMFNFFSQTGTLLFMLSVIKNRHAYKKYFQGVNEIFLKSRRFGVPILLSRRDLSKAQYGSMFVVLLIYTLTFLIFSLKIYSLGFGYINLVQAVSASLGIFCGGLSSLHFLYWLTIYEESLLKLLRLMRQEFEYRKKRCIIDTSVDNAFSDKIRLYQGFYVSFISNLEKHVLVYTTLFYDAWHFTFLIICQVYSFLYISFLLVHQDIQANSSSDNGIILSFSVVSLTFYAVNRSNNSHTISDEFILYLYKYPISILTEEESLQVEALVNILASCKPTFIAADIFVLQRKLLPSIGGHVITYSLVALQFNIFEYFH